MLGKSHKLACEKLLTSAKPAHNRAYLGLSVLAFFQSLAA